MNLERYPALKAAGKVKLQPIGNQVVVITKRYDVDLGTELNDAILPVDTTSLEKQMLELETKLKAIILFLNDVAAVKVE